MVAGPLRTLTLRVGRPTSSVLRHPLFRLLSCVFLTAVVLQYSGILLLTQRYTMSRFYDVMFLVSNNDNVTGSRRSLLEDVVVGGGRGGLTQGGKHKRIIARNLQPPGPEGVGERALQGDGDGEVLNNHIDQSKQRTPYVKYSERTKDLKERHQVPDAPPGDHRGSDLVEDTLDHVPPSRPPPADTKVPPPRTVPLAGAGPTKGGVMAPWWQLIRRLKGGFMAGPAPTPTTPVPPPPCPKRPANLDGPVPVLFSAPDWPELQKMHPEVQPGGHWTPTNCTARHKVALVIPFRDRDAHLRIFLQHMHPFLQKQLLDYTIYVVEQTAGTDFNRAMLMNVGFVEAERLTHHTCFVFHDVDLLPEVAQNMYSCPHLPRHMSAAVDSLGYRLPYAGIFGGVSALRTEHFRRVNGFSNCFFGWGGEDDDMYNRIKHHGLDITRYPLHIARYRMLSHKKEDPSNDRFTMLNSGKLRYDTDGITSLIYDLREVDRRPLYTLIRVHINKDDVIQRASDMSTAQDGGPPGEEADQDVLQPPSNPDTPQGARSQLIQDEVVRRQGAPAQVREGHTDTEQVVVLEEADKGPVPHDKGPAPHVPRDVASRLEKLLTAHKRKLKKELLIKERFIKEQFDKENADKEQDDKEQVQTEKLEKLKPAPPLEELGEKQRIKDRLGPPRSENEVLADSGERHGERSGERRSKPLLLGRPHPSKATRRTTRILPSRVRRPAS